MTIEMPLGAQVLTVQPQESRAAQLWALVDTNMPKTPYKFRIVGTGHPFDDADDWSYIDTFQMYGGDLVFHVFEEARR